MREHNKNPEIPSGMIETRSGLEVLLFELFTLKISVKVGHVIAPVKSA